MSRMGSISKRNISDEFLLPKKISNRYYTTPLMGVQMAVVTLTLGYLYAIPFAVARPESYSGILCEITTGQVNGLVRLGIYYDNGSMYPGTLLVDAGEGAGTAAAQIEKAITQTLGSGVYWLAVNTAGDAALVLRGFNTATGIAYTGSGGTSNEEQRVGYSKISTYGVLPTTFPSAGSYVASGSLPYIQLKKV